MESTKKQSTVRVSVHEPKQYHPTLEYKDPMVVPAVDDKEQLETSTSEEKLLPTDDTPASPAKAATSNLQY